MGLGLQRMGRRVSDSSGTAGFVPPARPHKGPVWSMRRPEALLLRRDYSRRAPHFSQSNDARTDPAIRGVGMPPGASQEHCLLRCVNERPDPVVPGGASVQSCGTVALPNGSRGY